MRKFIYLIVSIFFTTSLFSQNNFTTPILKTITGSSNSFSNNEGGTTTFSGTSNQILYSVQNGSYTFRKAPLTAPVYKVNRNNVTAQYTGATFYAEGTRITNGYNIVTTQPAGNTGDDVIISVFDRGYINSGEDNMFNNNTSSATHNNVERLDYIFPGGVTIVDNTKQGFIICERNKNDYFYIAIASGKDGSNNITSYYNTLIYTDPSNTQWSSVKPNFLSYPFKYDPTDISFQYPIGTTPGMGTQTMYGILYKFADFGIANGQTVYGISIAAGDAPTTASSWLTISNFPTNTPQSIGGMDFNGITGVYHEAVTISGKVYRDANGNTDNLINGTGLNNVDGTPIYAYLIDANQKVYDKQQPAADGTYSFAVAGNVSLTVMISTENLQLYQNAPTSSFAAGSSWVNTGEQFGTNNAAGTGIESGTANGKIALTTTFSTSTTNINFGIEKKPVVNNVSRSDINPGGTNRVVAATFAGSDNEDGTLGSGSTFKVVTLPSAALAVLYYTGIPVTAGQIIANYNPALLQVDPVDGNVTVVFTYSYADAAGVESNTATSTINFGSLTVSGNVYNDADGGTITTSTLLSTLSGQTIYAYLVNTSGNIIGKSTVTNGAFSFTNASANTSYTVRLSTTDATIGTACPAENLPIDWVNVGEALAGVLDGIIDGNIAISVGSSNISTVQFALNRRPTTNDVFTSAANPGGTIQVQAPTLVGNDPEDGTLGSGKSFKINTLPTNGTLYYNGSAVSVGQIITNYNPTLLKIDPTSTGIDLITFTYSSIDAGGKEDLTPATASLQVYIYTISGNVYDDANGGAITTTVPMNSIDGQQLYAYLVNTSGNIVEKKAIDAAGAYIFYNGTAGSSYTVRISTIDANIGQAAPSTALPTNWIYTDETYGTNNSIGSGSDANDNFQVSVTRTSGNVVGVNFAAEQLPDTYDVFGTAANPANDGTGTSATGKVQIPDLGGYDPEDGTKGTGSSFKILSLPSSSQGTLYYYNGSIYSPVAVGQVITNYNPTYLRADPYGTRRNDYQIIFTYAAIDAAGQVDPTPATAELDVFGSRIQISGTIYDDGDGGTPSGTEISEINGLPLYAYIINTSNIVEEYTPVNPDGTYMLYSANRNTNYTLKISTTVAPIGSSAPSTTLPTNWVNTRDLYGINNSSGTGYDATADFSIPVRRSSNGTITGVNFGVNQRPSSNNQTYTGVNPGGTNYVSTPALTGSDPEEGNYSYTSGKSIRIKSISNGNLTYNGTTLSVGSTVSYANISYLRMDPTFEGAGTSTITYNWIDGAGFEGLTPATVTYNFTGVSISGNVYNDANGATGGISGSSLNSVSGSQLYAYLNIGSGNVLQKVTIPSTGAFSFTNLSASSTYNITISTSDVSVGAATPTSAGLPSDWAAVGDDPGTGSIDGTPNGIAAVTTGSGNLTGVKFGFEKRPETNNISSVNANPGGTVSVQVPVLSGLDPEDGALGSGKTFKIVSLPTVATGKLYYNGVAVTAGQTITNYDPSKLTLDPVDGYVVATFTVAAIDVAGAADLSPATVTMTFTSKIISGTVYADPNGGTPSGVGINNVGSQLYAYLISGTTVYEKQTIASNGTFSFIKGAASTSYIVVISTANVSEGAQIPSSANLPVEWTATGDNYGTNNTSGTGNQSGTPDLRIGVITGQFDVSGVNFGVNKKPVAHSKDYLMQDLQGFPIVSGDATYPYVIPLNNASGTSDGNLITTAPPGKLSGSDNEMGSMAGASGTTSNLKVAFAGLPTNAYLVYNNGSSYIKLIPSPSASSPSYTYWNVAKSRYEIPNFNPSNLSLYFDPNDPNSIEFQYLWVDPVTNESTPANYIIEWDAESAPLPVELISLDALYLGNHKADILWTTASEVNSLKFVIEKSTDMMTFESIGEVMAQGNSNVLNNYSFRDQNCNANITYYRLRTIDIDGSFEISHVVYVQGEADFDVSLFPNPATDFINIQLNDNFNEITYQIFDNQGKMVMNNQLSEASNYRIDLQNMPAGIYYLKIYNQNRIKTIKFIRK